MEIKKPKGNWKVREVLNSEAVFCRHRAYPAYPANYVGCNHPQRVDPNGPPECCKEECPIKVGK